MLNYNLLSAKTAEQGRREAVITCLCNCHETGDIASCNAEGLCCELPGVLRFHDDQRPTNKPPAASVKHRPLTCPDFEDWYFSRTIGPPTK
ncbi:MAG: hypothetical protein HY980_01950 [Candidatus Magasanikbacteria bacterium]|nr:hypothetical protein [Candidatus Magasanikbacteria bacterium]